MQVEENKYEIYEEESKNDDSICDMHVDTKLDKLRFITLKAAILLDHEKWI